MSHFSVEAWFDFARGTTSPAERPAMQQHLDHGCQQCEKLCAMWRDVVELTRRENAYEPPESAVRSIKSMYVIERSRKLLPHVARMARLVLDSFQQPVPAGVRTSAHPARHLLHKAGSFLIDTRLESLPTLNRIFLAGQVMNSKDPNQGIEGANVVLLHGDELVVETVTNSFGEFQMNFENNRNLRMFVNIRKHWAIGIALPDPETFGLHESFLF